jgi:hypothetical protein
MRLAKQMRRSGAGLFALMGISFVIGFIGLVTGTHSSFKFEDLPPHVHDPLLLGALLLPPTLALFFGAEIARILADRALLARGESAEARILRIWKTGVRINKRPVVRVLLEVRPRYQQPFQAETERHLSVLQRVQIYPGAVVPVKYNPDTLEVTIVDETKA